MLMQNILGNGPGLNWFIPLGCLLSRSMDNLLLSIYRIQKSLQKSHIANVYLILSCVYIHSESYHFGSHPQLRNRVAHEAISHLRLFHIQGCNGMHPAKPAVSRRCLARRTKKAASPSHRLAVEHKEQRTETLCGAETPKACLDTLEISTVGLSSKQSVATR